MTVGSNNIAKSDTSITFGSVGSEVGSATVLYVGYMDAATGGNLLYVERLQYSLRVVRYYTFAAGSLALKER